MIWRPTYGSTPPAYSRAGGRALLFPWKAGCLSKLLLLLLGVALGKEACAAAVPMREFTRSLWRAQDGLPENIVQSVVQDRQGFLWVGTTGGLARFDGARFSPGTAVPLPVNSIFCLMRAQDGSLWAGTEGGGLLHLVDGRVQVFGMAEGLSDGFVRSVFEDRAGHVWVGTDKGLFLLDAGRLRRVSDASVHSITEDRQGRLWVGGAGVFTLTAGKREEFTLPGSYSQSRVKTIFETTAGEHWIGTVSGLLREIGGRFVPVPAIHATVRVLRQTSDGVLWIGTIGQGLWSYKDGVFTHVDAGGLLPSRTVLSLFEDENRTLWVGTQDGLVRLERTPVRLVRLPGGGDADFATISADRGGDAWMVARTVYRLHGGEAQAIRIPGLAGVAIRNLFRAKDGTLWVGTDGSGAYHLTGQGTVHYTAPRGLVNNFVRAFLETSRGEMWVATDEGVSRVTPGPVRNVTTADGLVYFSTRSLLEDRTHGLWIGTDHGLSHLRDGHFVDDVATRGLAGEKVWSILEDRAGALWFGTRDHGLFCLRDGALEHYTTAQGLATNGIYQILQDRTGRFWLSGPNTISSLPDEELRPAADRTDRSLQVTVYKIPFGAEETEMYGGRQPSGYLADDDTVWFPTTGGALHIVHEDQPAAALRLEIDGVTADSRALGSSRPLQIPARTARLAFGFEPLLLTSQEGLRFRYRLEGFDGAWIAAGAARSAVYTSLPAGRYRFRVAVYDTSRPESVAEASLELVQEPELYQTWWFRLFGVFMVALLAFTIYRLRVRRIGMNFAAVLEERSRLAREMHDTVIQGCTSVSALLEAIASVQSQEEPAGPLLGFARTQIRTTIDEARHAVWNLRHTGEAPVDLSQSLTSMAEHASSALGLPVMHQGTTSTELLPAPIAHEILMVVREALANAGSHAHPREIVIERSPSTTELLLIIRDNGQGFVQGASIKGEEHFGLTGMKERMERIGGSLQVKTALGQGTRIEIRLRLRDKERRWWRGNAH